MSPPRAEHHKVRYWDVIRWDATSFLTLSSSYCSRLYHGRARPSLMADTGRVLRGVASGTAHSVGGFMRAFLRRRPATHAVSPPDVLLITMGTDKYASEEDDFVQAVEAFSASIRARTLQQHCARRAWPHPLSRRQTTCTSTRVGCESSYPVSVGSSPETLCGEACSPR